jgi:Zn finger protein HypA/HybF involved in hydrogenase expression
MTPLQAAKAHCANYQPDGSCLGIAFRDDLSMYRFRAPSSCVFHEMPCQACPYFEQTVLPQVPASVAEQYRKSLVTGAKTTVRPQRGIKLCPDCHKRELEPRKRYCATCASTRKRESKRQHMRLKRGLDVEKREISPIGAQALTKAKKTISYPTPQTSVLNSSFSTPQGIARDAPEARHSLSPSEE